MALRRVVLDTETTGLEVELGHRVIEIGCVELVDRQPSGREFHRYLNPEREVGAGAVAVHGITDEFLRDKPRFAEVAQDFLAFIEGAELLIHNAAFDVGFLDAELALADDAAGKVHDHARIVDTLALAREKYPGQRNTLDALCKRLGVDNSHREVHGALLDAHLLADVWLAMTAGQGSLTLGVAAPASTVTPLASGAPSTPGRAPLRVLRASATENAAHAERLAALDAACVTGNLWRREQDGGA
ncbi:MAG TPA: DNA polymerase III subunit epsilon [Rhodanobacteraceae bacterium]|nr:DNA polymerase III subunit epsilon [Rhodanobacteraceae bacterium]